MPLSDERVFCIRVNSDCLDHLVKLNPVNWWGNFNLSPGDALRWTLGPLMLAVQRRASEWRIVWCRADVDVETDVDKWSVEPNSGLLDGWDNTERHAFRDTSSTLHVLPRLADRPVVTRPVAPFTVPAGESARLFVSTPLWVSMAVDHADGRLLDMPIVRPSDTWFGVDTQVGELCYASQTQGRMSLEDLPLRLHRAITSVHIENEAEAGLRLERLSLTVPYLSLFADRNGMLWTQDVTVQSGDHRDAVTLRLSEQPPADAEEPVMINGPRKEPDAPVLRRALSALFG